MKKFLCVIFVLAFSTCSFAQSKVGVLAQLNMTEEEYEKFVDEGRETVGFNFLSHDDEDFRYYDSLLTMQMALNAGEIDEVQLPEIVGEYFAIVNPSYSVSCVTQVRPTYLAFGFLEKNAALRDKINAVMSELREDGTLEKLRVDYIDNFMEANFNVVKPAKFDGAEKIKIALTGDLPPIDFVAADDTPAGFNMAIITEIGKRAKLNIEVFDIEAGARSAALASGRADAVLWYKFTQDAEHQPDIPSGIILSDPYYDWNKFLHIKKK